MSWSRRLFSNLLGVVLSLVLGNAASASHDFHAIVVRPTAAGQNSSPDISQLIYGLSRGGHRQVPRSGSSWQIELTRQSLRRSVNLLKHSPRPTTYLIHYSGSISLGEDGVLLGEDAKRVPLKSLLFPTRRLAAKTCTVVLLDTVCVGDPSQVEKEIHQYVRSCDWPLAVLLVCRPSAVKAGVGSTIRRAVTYDQTADHNSDHSISLNEVDRYLRRQPGAISRVYSARTVAAPRTIPIASVLPKNVEMLVDDIVDELVWMLGRHAADRVAIPDFAEAGPSRAVVGTLLPYLSHRITGRLASLSESVRIVERQELIAALTDIGASSDTIVERVVDLHDQLNTSGTTAVVLGMGSTTADKDSASLTTALEMIWVREGQVVRREKLSRSETVLGIEEVAMTGKVNMSPNRELIDWGWQIAELGASGDRAPHPLSDPNCPLRVYMEIGRNRVPYQFSIDKRRAYAAVNQGDKYSIIIENRTDQDLFLRLLVDGRNTLPDRSDQNKGQLQPAQVVSLARARCWFCEARSTYRVGGFFTNIEETESRFANAGLRTFEVSDAQHVALSAGYRDQAGIITAAFYTAVPKHKSSLGNTPQFATRLGTAQQQKVVVYEGQYGPGQLVGDAPINIRYGYRIEEELTSVSK